MLLADVAIDVATKSLDDPYTYAVPSSLLEEGLDGTHRIEVGCAVQVPFGGRSAVGFVLGMHEGDEFKGLKEIKSVLSKSFFDEHGAECAKFLSKRYVAPLSTCVRLFTPTGGVPRMVRSREGQWRIERPRIEEVDDRWLTLGENGMAFTPRKNAVKQIAVLDAVREGDIKVSELNMLYGNVSSAITSLAKAGAVKVEHRRRMRGEAAAKGTRGASPDASSLNGSFEYKLVEAPKDLTDGQANALRLIDEAYAKHAGEVLLIDGVTGSGKTEVYLQAMDRALKEGKSAMILVPEIALTPQTVARFRGRFGDEVAVLHSRMGAGERYDSWDMIRSGEARIVVGARSAMFSPVQDLGLIIIDEEHETTYKQESAPRYVSRDVATWLMAKRRGTLILGSATPSIDALYKANRNESWHVAEMPERANGRPMPKIEVVDMTQEVRDGKGEMFSLRLKNAMKGELSLDHKVVLLLNQRGFAQFLLCKDCGFVPKCVSCSTTLTYHAKGNKLICHHCGYTVDAPPRCPVCNSPYMSKHGAGTERVEDELRMFLDAEFGEMPGITGFKKAGGVAPVEGEEQFGALELSRSVPVIRMDADTTSKKGAHRKLLEQFSEAPRAVLLGTQMIAKGLDFDDVSLVGVINADTQLHLPDFRSEERTFDLIEQVAGRAGRAEIPGKVIVQTYEADNVAIQAAAHYDRDMFLRSELPKRRILKYPPYVRMANIIVWGKRESDVKAEAIEFYGKLVQAVDSLRLDDWDVLAASPCVFERIRNDYRWHIIVKCPVGKDISAFLYDIYKTRKPSKTVSMAIDVDPIDLL